MRLLGALAVLLAASACRRDPPLFHGWAEADEVRVSPIATGTLLTLSVERGRRVDAGTPLFTQDDVAERAARDEATARLSQAEALLRNLEQSGRATDLDAAEAQVRESRSALELARSDLARAEELASAGATPAARLDQARATAVQAAARLRSAEARLRTLQTSVGRSQEILAQRSATDMARATVAQAEWRLQQRRTSAPAAGLVVDTFFRPGEVVPAGIAVLSLLPPGALRVRFFVPEPELGRLLIGAPVQVRCDGCPSELEARVAYVSPSPEFTPPVVYAGDSRAKLVYLVEARGPSLDALHPGQPLDVRVPR